MVGVDGHREVGASTAHELPPKTQSDALLYRFWTHVYIQWLDRAEFEEWYEALWTSESPHDSGGKIFQLATLNLVFALVYRTEPDFEDNRDHLAQTHFGRAQNLLKSSIFELDRMELLYALFLMLQWYQSVNDVQRCQYLIKLCILVAQNIGIDDTDRVAAYKNQRQREIARRAWHGCILMDRIVAMVSGRVPQIPQGIARAAPIFASIDDEYLTSSGADGYQPKDNFSGQEFFLSFCKLHLILGDILIENQLAGSTDINRIIEFDSALHRFYDCLPQELRYDITNNRYLGQAVHLRTRFLYIKILLYRPYFTRASKNTNSHSNASFGDIIIHEGLLQCVSAALELLNLLDARHTTGDRRPGTIPQWWHTIGYVYSAATVVIAAHLFDHILSTRQSQLDVAISQSFSILDSYKRYRQPAQNCKKALESLYSRYVVRKISHVESSASKEQDEELADHPWAWDGLLDLFGDNSMFDFGLEN